MNLLLLTFLLFQGNPIEDIKLKLDSANDTTKVMLYADLCYQYRFIDQDSSLMFGEKAVELARKIDFQRGLASSLSDLGVAYLDQSNFDKAKELWNESLDIRKKINDKQGIGGIYMKLGVIDFQIGQMDSAAENFLNALRLFEEIKDKGAITHALNNVAAIYEHQERLDEAAKYYWKSFDLAKDEDNAHNMGVACINLGNIKYRQEDYDSAIYFATEAVAYLDGDQNALGFLSRAINNLSEYFIKTNDIASAKEYAIRGLKLRQQIGDSVGIVSSLNNMATVQMHSRDYRNAEVNLAVALEIASKKGLKVEQSKIYRSLSSLYSSTGRNAEALDAFVKYHDINEILRGNDQAKQIAELNTRYETEKKEQQIALQDLELQQKQAEIKLNYTIIATMAAVLVLLMTIFFLLRSRMKRKQELLQKEGEIAVREALINATIQSQETERKRFAQDLHDGMGQLISALRLMITNLQGNVSMEARVEAVSKSEKLIDDMQREVRAIAFNLMPQTLIQQGLVPALKEMALRISASGKKHMNVSAFGIPERFTEIQEISLYRIIQEWANNILKHSEATNIDVQLVGHKEELSVTVEDNGQGFDVMKLEESSGNGWRNIQSRLNIIHGALEIDSSIGRKGNTLTIRVPINLEIEGLPESKIPIDTDAR